MRDAGSNAEKDRRPEKIPNDRHSDAGRSGGRIYNGICTPCKLWSSHEGRKRIRGRTAFLGSEHEGVGTDFRAGDKGILAEIYRRGDAGRMTC